MEVPLRRLLPAWLLLLFVTVSWHPVAAQSNDSESSSKPLITVDEVEPTPVAEPFTIEEPSADVSSKDDYVLPVAYQSRNHATIMISVRPALWTGAVTMILLVPLFGRFRRRLLI